MLLVGSGGILSLPPDEHEVLVLQTAQEMWARGDWITPYFNAEARLNKPPLNYWASAAVAGLAGSAGVVLPWHGRLVSLIGGLVLAGVALGLSRERGIDRVWWVAPALLVTSAGWFSFVHDARPDALYAACCALGSLCFWLSLERWGQAGARRFLFGMWLCYALGTLSKGPHVPAMLLAANLAFELHSHRHAARPERWMAWLSGLLLFLTVVLPWWWLLQERVSTAALASSQLSGKLLQPDSSGSGAYYLYRPLQLLLPWILLAPFTWPFAFTKSQKQRGQSIWMFASIATMATALSFGPQQRYFYMLPALPFMIALTARGWISLEERAPRTALFVALLQTLLVLALAIWSGLKISQPIITLAAALLALCFSGVALWRGLALPRSVLLCGMLLAAGVFVLHASGTLLWSEDRYNKAALAESARQIIPMGALLVAYDLTPVVYVYLSQRPIERVRNPERLASLARIREDQSLYVLCETRHRPVLETLGSLVVLAEMPPGADDRAGLYRMRLSPQTSSGTGDREHSFAPVRPSGMIREH